MTKIYLQDFYLKRVKSQKRIRFDEFWSRDEQLIYSAEHGRSAYNKKYTMIETLVAVSNYFLENGHLPSVRQLAKVLKRGEKSTFDRIKRLSEAGYIAKNDKGEITLLKDFTV